MVPCESALEIYSEGRLNGGVSAQFNGGTGNESAGGHDHIAVITGHGPGFRRDVAVHRGRCLDAFTELNDMLRLMEYYSLDNVMAAFRGIGNTLKSQLFVNRGGKNRAL